MQKEWLTMKETQKLLNYSSRGAVYKFVKRFQIKATRPMGQIYFSYAEIMTVLEERAVVFSL